MPEPWRCRDEQSGSSRGYPGEHGDDGDVERRTAGAEEHSRPQPLRDLWHLPDEPREAVEPPDAAQVVGVRRRKPPVPDERIGREREAATTGDLRPEDDVLTEPARHVTEHRQGGKPAEPDELLSVEPEVARLEQPARRVDGDGAVPRAVVSSGRLR